MRPDDENDETVDPNDPGAGDEPPDGENAAEHEVPPSTWAGRERSGGDDEPAASDPGGFTDEFDQIERDLDAELEGLGEDEEPAEPEEAPEPVAAAEPDEAPAGEEPEAPEEEPAEEAEEDEGEAEKAEEPAAEADAPEAEEPAPEEPAAGATVEAETVGIADREQAEESALAGLKARTDDTKWAAASADDGDNGTGEPPRAKRLWARFLAATILIVAATAAATSISLLVYLTDIAADLYDNDALGKKVREELAGVDGGDPQNILILGSDERLDLPGDKRSDTTILLRVDPDQQAISLLSIPRDLRVSIPNHGIDKFNAAYSYGGPKLTLLTLKNLLGPEVEIHHLVNINFTGFADAVNAIDCVYIDVDRRYYIPAESEVAEIDIEAGYQRLCGFHALQYVRFRHDDNDLIRAARQQDFLREARQKVPPSKLIEDRNELIEIFTEHTTSDIDDPIALLELLKTFVNARNAVLNEVHFPADLGDGTTGYVTASEKAIKETLNTFLGNEGTPGPPEAGESAEPAEGDSEGDGEGGGNGDGGKDEEKDEPKPEEDNGPTMDDATAQGEQFANQISKVKTRGGEPMVEFPIFYPTELVPGSTINSATRAFPIDGPGDDVYHGYKMVVDVPGEYFGNGLLSEYYGISGTDWKEPPILANPSDTQDIDGRTYDLYYDGDRLRLVGWHDKRGNSYWVNNTLSQSLGYDQMIAIAVSARQLDG